jgi:inhibitor of KinA
MRAHLLALSDSAVLIQLGHEIDPTLNQSVHALDARLRANNLQGVIETVPAYASLAVHYDPLVLTHAQVCEWVQAETARVGTGVASKPRRIEVPVRYGGAGGPDLEYVAAYHGMTPSEVVQIHTSRDYVVYMMGFTPGFPYLGKLEPAIATPRLETPRTHVPAGSVGIAGEQTGIYPIDSPGGWRIIGSTRLDLFDVGAGSPFLLSPGDSVRFVAEGPDA